MKAPRELRAYISGAIAPAALVGALQSDNPLLSAALGGVFVTAGGLWIQAMGNGPKAAPRRATSSQFASVASSGLAWRLGFGRENSKDTIRYYDRRGDLPSAFVFQSMPFCELNGIVPEAKLLHFCKAAYRWWRVHDTGQDIARNGRRRTINQVLSVARFRELREPRLAPVEITDCMLILLAAGIIHYEPRRAARLLVLMMPHTMVRHCKALWGDSHF